jgi:hypothetical protein
MHAISIQMHGLSPGNPQQSHIFERGFMQKAPLTKEKRARFPSPVFSSILVTANPWRRRRYTLNKK